jgi:hypothetical protein
MPKVILCIGYTDILLPDDKGISQVLTTLAKGGRVQDRLYNKTIVIDDGRDPLEISMRIVPASTRFVRETPAGEEPVEVVPMPAVRGRSLKRLTAN